MNRAWSLLVVAGLLEVVWAVGLKFTHGFTRPGPSAVTIGGMVASFYCLAQALKAIPVGTGYAVWTGIGAVGTAVVGLWLLDEPRTLGRLVSIGLIVLGIVGLKLSTPG